MSVNCAASAALREKLVRDPSRNACIPNPSVEFQIAVAVPLSWVELSWLYSLAVTVIASSMRNKDSVASRIPCVGDESGANSMMNPPRYGVLNPITSWSGVLVSATDTSHRAGVVGGVKTLLDRVRGSPGPMNPPDAVGIMFMTTALSPVSFVATTYWASTPMVEQKPN